MRKNIAYAIGNGTSRGSIDIETLKISGSVYGCNALYRDVTPDVLVATDRGIAEEIESSGYPKLHPFYTRRPNKSAGSLEIPNHWKGWSSGPVSVALALDQGYKLVYLIGHDFGGSSKEFNNCYAGTPNYREVGSAPTYAGNWIKQIKTLLETFGNSKIIRVVGEGSASVPSLESIKNYSEVDIHTFGSSINT